MNNSLISFNSTIGLSSRLQDIIYVFVIPAMCFLLFWLKIVSILVLRVIIKKKKKAQLNQFYYLLSYETCDLIQATIACFGALLRCGNYCEYGYTFVAKILDFVFYTYGVPVCLQFQAFMEISFSLERMRAFKVTSASNANAFKFKTNLAICLVVSLIAAVPNYLMSRTISPIGILIPSNQTLYVISTRSFVQTYFWTIGLFVFNLLKGLVLMLGLLVVNIFFIYKLNLFIKDRRNIVQEDTRMNKTENRQTKKIVDVSKLLLAINTNFLIGTLPNYLSPVLYLIFGSKSQLYAYYSTITSIILILSHFNYIFLYTFLNRAFRRTLFSIFIKDDI